MALLLFSFPVSAAAPIEQSFDNRSRVVLEAPKLPQEESNTSISTYIANEAYKNNVDKSVALFVWSHEGGEDLSALGDMDLVCAHGPNAGKPVRARGPWQLTDCYYPNVPDKCAFDLQCSTAIALPLLRNKSTCVNQFSTCRDYYTQNTPS